MAKSKNKFYVVWVGETPGIYKTWNECLLQTKGFPNAKYKSFKTLAEAEEAFHGSAVDYISTKSKSEQKPKAHFLTFKDQIVEDSISVDAACSGNPGIMEYRGVETFSQQELFKIGPYNGGTNNLGEFLALVHGLAYLKKLGNDHSALYSDSRTALSWLRKKHVKTTLKKSRTNKLVFEHVDRAMHWVKSNTYKTKVIKWETKVWGEIPADFGRK